MSSPPLRPRPLWLDCDPGHDDALAIVLAAHSPSLVDLLGVSTVASNHTLEAVTANAAAVLAAVDARRSGESDGSDNETVPLHAGASSPLLLPPKACPEIHGSSGLCVSGGAFADVVAGRLRERCKEHFLVPARKGAVEAMAEAIERAAEELEREKDGRKVALVATGALTNVALLLWTRPDLIGRFELYLMGGAVGQGNTGVVAEFNFEVDPHAAAAVFGFGETGRGGLSITMVPLEVTHTALVTPTVLSKLGLGGDGGEDDGPPLSPLREALRSVLLYFSKTYSEHFGFDVGPPLHDPLAVLAAMSPSRFSLTRARVDVETCSGLSLGQSVVDLRPELGRSASRGEPNAWVATSVDLERLWELLGEAIGRADLASPL